jgi:hypothetical protein
MSYEDGVLLYQEYLQTRDQEVFGYAMENFFDPKEIPEGKLELRIKELSEMVPLSHKPFVAYYLNINTANKFPKEDFAGLLKKYEIENIGNDKLLMKYDN